LKSILQDHKLNIENIIDFNKKESNIQKTKRDYDEIDQSGGQCLVDLMSIQSSIHNSRD